MKKNLLSLPIMLSFIGLSTISNAQWTQINTGLLDIEVNALLTSGSNLFAGTGSLSSVASGNNGVYLSTDNGDNWTEKNSGMVSINPPYNYGVNCFVVSGSTLFAGGDGENSGGLYKSTDNGTTWTPANTGIPNGTDILSLTIDGSKIYAGGDDDNVYLSNDNGATWTAGTNVTGSGGKVRALAISGSSVFAGCGNRGVFKSTDSGSTWTAVNTGLTGENIYALTISGSNIFAGAYGGGVFLSSDDGANWVSKKVGLTSPLVKALTVISGNLLAGTESYGTFMSNDNGTTWMTTGSTGQSVVALAYDATYLYAGTKSDGVFRRLLTEIIMPVGINNLSNNHELSIYPNPSSGIFQFDAKENINSIKVFNLLGAEVYNESVKGNGTKTVDLSHLPVGTYMLQIGSDKSVVTKKIEIKK